MLARGANKYAHGATWDAPYSPSSCQKHLEPFAQVIQALTNRGLGVQDDVLGTSVDMMCCWNTLLEMCGIVCILERTPDGNTVQAASGSETLPLRRSNFGAFAWTHLAHRCWHWFPSFVRRLPHI